MGKSCRREGASRPAISVGLVPSWPPVASPAVAASSVAAPEPALTRRGRRRGKRRRHHLRVDALLDRLALGRQLLDRGLPAQVEAALAVDLDSFDHDLVADVADLFDALHAVVGELGDVNQAILARKHLDERAERHDPHDLAPVDLPHLDFVGQALDPVDRLLAAFLVDGGDEDPTVVFHIDLRPRLFGDLAEHLASWADDVADLVGVDEDRGDPRGVVAHLGARSRQNRQHLVEHEEPRLARLLECLGHDLVGQALDLDDHLQRGDAVAGAGDLEVHVTEFVFDALDVGQDREFAFAGDQAHRDSRDRRLDGHPRVHQRKRRAADRSHRCRSVGAQNLRDQADGVWKVFYRWDDRQQCALRECAVADLAPARPALRPRLADRIRREVVVVHEALELFCRQAVELLLVGHRAERGDRQGLRLAAREQPRSVRSRQHAHLDGDRPHVFQATTVDTHPLLDDALPNAVLQGLVEELADDVRVVRKTLAKLQDRPSPQLVETVLAGLLVGAVKDLIEAQGEIFAHDLEHVLGVGGRDPLPLLEPDLLLQLELGGADSLDLLVGCSQRVEHHLLAHALGPGLDHQDRVRRAGDDEVELRVHHLRHRRVDDDLAVEVAHAHRADRTLERNIGYHERGRRAVDAQDGGVVFLVDRQHGRDDLHVQPETFREERPQRPVGQTRREDRRLARAAFPAHERARDLACRVQLLLVVTREGEPVDPFPWLFGHHRRAEHHRVALADDDRPVCLFRHATGLDRDPPPCDVYVFRDYCHAKYLQMWWEGPGGATYRVRFLAAAAWRNQARASKS